MKERPVRFGEDQHLVGVITEAGRENPGAGSTAAIILNAGILHRIGPNRLHTQLARRLAGAGFDVLRFDLSRLGDSDVRKQALAYDESNLRDVQEAMRLMSRSGSIRRFILMGICSGADIAIRVAQQDPRVAGALVIEGYNFTTPGYHLDYFVRRLVRPGTWVKLFQGKLGIANILKTLVQMIRPKISEDMESESQQVWQLPPTEKIISALRSVLNRGTNLCFVYAEGSPAHFIYRSRIQKGIRDLVAQQKMQVISFEGTDHTFTPLSQQKMLVDAVCRWCRSNFRQSPL